jgi:hypothetical protein
MINLQALTQDDIGREVIYRRAHGYEYGRITSWNDAFVFVRYYLSVDADSMTEIHRSGETSQATRPADLEFI